MVIARINIKDVGKPFVAKQIAYIYNLSERDTKRLAEVTKEVIQQTIQTTADNPTGNLASGFLVDKIPGGYGVGDIEQLNNHLPYWRHVNYGSEGIGADWEHFLPKGRWVNGRWLKGAEGGFSGIKPKTPIQPLNYIEKTLAQLNTIIKQVLSENK